jgi:predicted GH43/DUF377 family glycosyl hydrolase
MRDLFTRDPGNPILQPGGDWWDARGVLNPGVAVVDGRVLLVYRAVGHDNLGRFGVTWSDDGRRFPDRSFLCEADRSDSSARLGIEDPRLTVIDGVVWATYTKAAIEPVGAPIPVWEPAPYRVRMALARLDPARGLVDERPLLAELQSKDGVLFPERINGRYVALIREWPAIQITSSADLRVWDAPTPLLGPIPGTWEGERVGAGPPPVLTPYGWLLIYHGNEFYQPEGNQRLYRTGCALLDRDDPTIVRYRHPDPIFSPETAYEIAGPVGMVVFATGLITWQNQFFLYYGAADGAIGLATAPTQAMYDFLGSVAAR